MKLKTVEIENYRAIEHLRLPLDPSLTVLHGDNTCGKTSVLSAIAVGLGVIPEFLRGGSGVNFLETDLRNGASSVRVVLAVANVALTGTDEGKWERRMDGSSSPTILSMMSPELLSMQQKLYDISRTDVEGRTADLPLPIVAFYNTDRAVLDAAKDGVTSQLRRYAATAAGEEMLARIGRSHHYRHSALDGALSAHTDFPKLFEWFYAKENDELRKQKKRGDFDHHEKDLSAVRNAISLMVNGVAAPHVEVDPLRLSVSVKLESGRVDTLEIDQLSDGQRGVLALAADLAWRMAQGNPHLDDPLTSEAIVLIDEVELHLHPSWQQRILDDLRRTFPNTQFIVSTHSPQVLTTVEPERIVELALEDGRIVAGAAAGWTYGAEAGDVLSAVMGVKERPVNEFTKKLDRYRGLIRDDQGESEEALALRKELERRSPDDPALGRADIEIRRRKLLRQMGKST